MPNDLRPTGIEALGEMPWGTHLCHFYETKQDLLDILVPYFKTGLESNEFCLWIISSSLNVAEATGALQKSVPDLEKHLAKRSMEILVPSSAAEIPDWEAPRLDLKSHVANGSIEIVPHDQWYLDGGKFDPVRVINRWKEKLHQALAHGYSGMRVHGNEAWLKETDWKNFLAYESQLNEMIAGQRMIVLCTYPLGTRKAGEIFDVARTHQLAIAKRHGHWEMLETPEIKQTKVKLAELTENLERRVRKRTSELTLLNQQFQETQRKLEEAQRIAHVGHWERDLKTDAVTWSAEIYRIFGLSPEGPRILFPQFLKLIHPEDRARIARAVDESARGLHHYAVEYRILRADNEVRFVRSEGEVLRDESGEPLRAFGILEDITERKRMEDALRESEGQLRLVIDTLPMMAWIVLPDGSMDFINKRWLAYSGLSLEEALKDPIGTMHPEDLAAVKEKWSACMASSKAYEGEMRLRRGDGEYRWFLVRTEPFFDGQGNLLRWYGTSTDIEDRKRAEGALRDTQTVLAGVMRATVAGELTASIAHEVNQPLGAVVTNANAALRWLNGIPPVLDEVREALQRIVRDGNRASEVVARIRGLLKDGTPIKTEFDLGDAIAEIVALSEAEAQRRQVSVHTQLTPALPRITADRVQIQQVLMNLTMNALDALSEVMDRSRFLTIQADMDSPDSVRVAVRDTGIGIDPAFTKRLFEPFYTTKTHGLGLGLSISRSIIEEHRGRLWMSPNEGPGVTFQFTLPLGAHDPA